MNADTDKTGLVACLLRDQQYLKEELKRCHESTRGLLVEQLTAVEQRLEQLRTQQSSTP